MTETARRLRRLGAPHARARALAVLLGGLGAALAAAALGLALSPAASGVMLAWGLIGGSGAHRGAPVCRGLAGVGPRRRVLASGAHLAGRARARAPGGRPADRASRRQRHGDNHRAGRGTRDTLDARGR